MYGTKVDVHCPYVVSFIYIIKQVVHIYVAYCRPNGWTDWAGIFLWTHTHWWQGDVISNYNESKFVKMKLVVI